MKVDIYSNVHLIQKFVLFFSSFLFRKLSWSIRILIKSFTTSVQQKIKLCNKLSIFWKRELLKFKITAHPCYYVYSFFLIFSFCLPAWPIIMTSESPGKTKSSLLILTDHSLSVQKSKTTSITCFSFC